MWFIELGLLTYFILKRDRFQTTAIFIGSASTVHNSLKVMFQNFTNIQLEFRNYFILKRYRFLTTTIFIGFASTVRKSFNIMF